MPAATGWLAGCGASAVICGWFGSVVLVAGCADAGVLTVKSSAVAVSAVVLLFSCEQAITKNAEAATKSWVVNFMC